MGENRKNLRYRTLARARVLGIEGIAGGEALLKDLSITGCCVESTSYPEIKLDTRYKIEVMPEAASNIGDFELLTESKWLHTGSYSCEIGFAILESPKGRSFQRYVDYLSWRSEAGNSSGSPSI
jgi:hypothetical protein